MKFDYKSIVTIVVVLAISFLLGRYTVKPTIEEIVTEKVIVDTLVIEKPVVDTVTHIKYVERYLPTTIEKVDTLIVRDSIKVYVPINNYLFEEPNKYRIEASGYEVSLDKVELFPKTVYKTETKVVKKENGFGIGVQVGYGICGNKVSPYVGIGIQYNLITF